MHEHDHAHEFHSHDEEDHVHVHDNTDGIHKHECQHHLHKPVWHDFEDEAFDMNSEMSYNEQMELYRDTSLKSKMLSEPWRPMRVKYVYDYLTGFPHSKINFLKRDLLEPTRSLWSRLLKVKRNPQGVRSSSSSCYKINGISGGT